MDRASKPTLPEAVEAASGSSSDELIALTYATLRRIASAHLRREAAGHTLQPTALVHEAYLRLASADDRVQQDHAGFCAAAARMMRVILVDHARRRAALKRSGQRHRVVLSDHLALVEERSIDLINLDEALKKLASRNEDLARVIELRFFAQLTVEEVAVLLGRSERSIRRDFQYAKAWLRRELG